MFYISVLCRIFYHSCGPCSAASLSLSFASQVGRYLIRNAPSFAPVDDVARQQQVRERLDQDPEPRWHFQSSGSVQLRADGVVYTRALAKVVQEPW